MQLAFLFARFQRLSPFVLPHIRRIVLVFLLLVGSVTGAQIGSQIAVKAKPEVLRLILAATVLAVAFRMFLGLFYQPEEIYTLYPL